MGLATEVLRSHTRPNGPSHFGGRSSRASTGLASRNSAASLFRADLAHSGDVNVGLTATSLPRWSFRARASRLSGAPLTDGGKMTDEGNGSHGATTSHCARQQISASPHAPSDLVTVRSLAEQMLREVDRLEQSATRDVVQIGSTVEVPSPSFSYLKKEASASVEATTGPHTILKNAYQSPATIPVPDPQKQTGISAADLPIAKAIEDACSLAMPSEAKQELLMAHGNGVNGHGTEEVDKASSSDASAWSLDRRKDLYECEADRRSSKEEGEYEMEVPTEQLGGRASKPWTSTSQDALHTERGMAELCRWWEALGLEIADVLTIPQLSRMCTHAFGARANKQTMQWVVASIEVIIRASMGMPPINVRSTRKLVSDESSGFKTSLKPDMLNITFDVFVKLMLWTNLQEHIAPHDEARVLKLRDAIVVNVIDQLIERYSHWPMPDFLALRRPWWEWTLEIFVGIVIVTNAIVIGIAADVDWEGFLRLETCFTVFFSLELFLKLYWFGLRRHLCGPEAWMNFFEATIVALAIIDTTLTLLYGSASTGNLMIMRLARLLRMARMMRLFRLLRLDIFKPLMMMVKGVVAGLRTLLWAMVLMMILVYTSAVFLRQSMGNAVVRGVGIEDTTIFADMSSAMFNVFRCFIGSCTLADGTPMEVHLYEKYGFSFVVPYAGVMIFTMFGMFNLIMAIFVENVQEAAKQKQQLSQDHERARVWLKLRQLVLRFGGVTEDSITPLKECLWSVSHRLQMSVGGRVMDDPGIRNNKVEGQVHFALGGQISRVMFDLVTRNNDVKWLLDELEIFVADPVELFDVLDADGSQYVDITELVAGLLKLRSGGADKSDIVTVILGVRALQKDIAHVADAQKEVFSILDNVGNFAGCIDGGGNANVTQGVSFGRLQASRVGYAVHAGAACEELRTEDICLEPANPSSGDFADL